MSYFSGVLVPRIFCQNMVSKLLRDCSISPLWVMPLVRRVGEAGFDCQQKQTDAPTSALFAGYKEHSEMLQPKIRNKTMTIAPAHTVQVAYM